MSEDTAQEIADPPVTPQECTYRIYIQVEAYPPARVADKFSPGTIYGEDRTDQDDLIDGWEIDHGGLLFELRVLDPEVFKVKGRAELIGLIQKSIDHHFNGKRLDAIEEEEA